MEEPALVFGTRVCLLEPSWDPASSRVSSCCDLQERAATCTCCHTRHTQEKGCDHAGRKDPAAGKGLVLFARPPWSNKEDKMRDFSSLGHNVFPGVFLTQ